MPQFCERDLDTFSTLFERVAESRGWSDSDRTVLLQCVFTGKAQEAYLALTLRESRVYATVKTAVLRAYELVPEAYRQRFRTWEKSVKQTHMEFARELCTHFSRWCGALKVSTYEALCDLIVLEQFKNSVPGHIAVYISEHKVKTVTEAAALADEYVLVHQSECEFRTRDNGVESRLLRTVSKWEEKYHPPSKSVRPMRGFAPLDSGKVCNYCKGSGHWKGDCPKRGRAKELAQVKPAACVTSNKCIKPVLCQQVKPEGGPEEATFSAFVSDGRVSLGNSNTAVPVKILRDTVAFDSYIVISALPFSDVTATGEFILMRGMGLTVSPVPLHKFVLNCGLVQGEVSMGVRPALPIEGVDIILSNGLAGSRVWADGAPPPIVSSSPSVAVERDDSAQSFPEVFTACAVTRAMRRAQGAQEDVETVDGGTCPVFFPDSLLSVSRSDLVMEQRADPTLRELYGRVVTTAEGRYKYKYQYILRYFFWPRVKRDVSSYIRTCHTCQMTGKPNQGITPAPLYPIPAIAQPFEHLIIDCVGPLPCSKSGCKYLLTVMCQSTRYPAAYPLRSITARSVVKALTQFISVFGIPKVIQSDQGSNFSSHLFAQVLRQLNVHHNRASAYHAQSQGALERFHQTLKSLLRGYCVELNQDWEEGLPWLLLAAREVVQESTGFSPNELVFSHTVHGPLTLLLDSIAKPEPPINLVDYINGFRHRLYTAGELAREKLTASQGKMKLLYDRKAEPRHFSPGDRVLALLPLVTSPFQAGFTGPFTVLRQVSDQNYLLSTPKRRKSTQLCHINLLKPYNAHVPAVTDPGGREHELSGVSVSGVATVGSVSPDCGSVREEDGVTSPDKGLLSGRLKNSQTLTNLEKFLGHLSAEKIAELSALIGSFSQLFGDTPSQTHLVEHDIDVGDALPIRQRYYRVSDQKRKVMDSEIRYMGRGYTHLLHLFVCFPLNFIVLHFLF